MSIPIPVMVLIRETASAPDEAAANAVGRTSPLFGESLTITGRFAETENTFWGGEHAIAGFEGVREIGFRANGLAYIPRRYCVARALMDDPRIPTDDRMRKRTAVYSIAANAGIIGVSWGVEWCVVGLDRNHAYAPDCYVLRPIIERWIGQYKWLADYGLKARY